MKFLIQSSAMTYLSCFILCCSLCQAKQAEVELMHWWNQPGEIQALKVIKKAVEHRGGKFVETRISSWDKLRSSIIERISFGYSPAATQWLVDDDISELNSIKAIKPLPSRFHGKAIKDILLDQVYQDITKNGQLLSLPLGIHIQNISIFNAHIYSELKLALPSTWSEFLEQAPVIQNAGYIPIAVSQELWQFNMLFEAIMIEQLGPNNFKHLYDRGSSIKHLREPLIKSMSIFLALKKYSDKSQRQRNWADATRLIGDNKAAMQIMGDFAKAELTTSGLKAGQDFTCSLSPGSNGFMVYAIDSFMMLNIEEDYLREGQSILFDVALDSNVQVNYNRNKGSIPVRKDIDINRLDDCGRKSYQRWIAHSDSNISRFSGVANPLRTSFFQSVLEKAWYQDNLSAEQLIDQLVEIDESVLKQPHRNHGRSVKQ